MPTSSFSPEEAAALKASFLRLIPKSDEFAESLYRHLFRLAPSVRALFAPSMDEQYYKVVRTLAVMVDAVDEPEVFERECRESGERHGRYGARPEHYPVLGQAIVAALRDTLGPTPEEEALWLRLYGEASRLMIEAQS